MTADPAMQRLKISLAYFGCPIDDLRPDDYEEGLRRLGAAITAHGLTGRALIAALVELEQLSAWDEQVSL